MAGALPALSLPFWQTGWAVTFLPALVAGLSTAYAFWRLAELGLARLGGEGERQPAPTGQRNASPGG